MTQVAAAEIRGHIHLLRADLLLAENKIVVAAKEIDEASTAFGGGGNPALPSYAAIKKFQLLLLQDDTAGSPLALPFSKLENMSYSLTSARALLTAAVLFGRSPRCGPARCEHGKRARALFAHSDALPSTRSPPLPEAIPFSFRSPKTGSKHCSFGTNLKDVIVQTGAACK